MALFCIGFLKISFLEDILGFKLQFMYLIFSFFVSPLVLDMDRKSMESSASIDVKALEKSPSIGFRSPLHDHMESLKDNEFANRLNARRSTSFRATTYNLADLQSATGNFATGRLIGEGSIGRVYRAKYADGKV